VAPKVSVFANYSKGLQVPGTDNLYNSFFYTAGTANAKPSPETTDNFDLGVRYRSGKLQAQFSGWYTSFKNRLASAYDRDLGVTIYRNLGSVEKYGVDGSVSYSPIPQVTLYTFGSYLKSKIKANIDAGVACTAANVAAGQLGCTSVGSVAFFQTAGKRESGAPIYTLGGRVEGTLGPVQLGIQAKRTGSRYVNDQNLPVLVSGAQVYGAKAIGYTLVDLDARFSLKAIGLNDSTYFQLNVTNLFDKLYVGGFDGGTTSQTSVLFANIGAPRTVVGTLVIGF
jgi:iron complex outermembrane receptor protein